MTLQPLVVLLGASALGSHLGALSQVLFLAAGMAGLPVFAFAPDLAHGLARLAGPTGGYLLAFPLAAWATGWLAERGLDRRYATSVVAMLAGLAVIYLGGTAWLAASAGIAAALALGVYPFVLADGIKILIAAALLPTAWRWLRTSQP